MERREVGKVSPNTSVEENRGKETVGIQSNNTSPSSEDSQALQRVLDYRLNEILRERSRVSDSSNIHLFRMRLAAMTQMEEVRAITESLKGTRSKSFERGGE